MTTPAPAPPLHTPHRGPTLQVLPIQKVASDEEAIALMNDSEFGLTAAVYTSSPERAEMVAGLVDAGTIFMNRCDYLDPYLAWVGYKDSGKGHSLSQHARGTLTIPCTSTRT